MNQTDEEIQTDPLAAAEGIGPENPRSAGEPSLGETVARLTRSAKSLAEAEITLAKARGSVIASATQRIAIYGVIAFIVAFGMIVTLMIGAVLALAPLWGLGLAVLAVTGIALLAIALCGLGIRAQVGRIREGVR